MVRHSHRSPLNLRGWRWPSLYAIVRNPIVEPAFVSVTFFCLVIVYAVAHPTWFYSYSLLADAWVQGHAWVVIPGNWIDAVPFHGRAYLIQAPFPSVLMIPFALAGHSGGNQSIVCAIVFAAGCGLVIWIARMLGLPRWQRTAFVFFFVFATSLFFAAREADTWNFAAICSVTFTLAALALLLKNGKPEFILFFALCAGFSRYSLLPVTGLYVAYMYATRGRRAWPRITLETVALIVPVIALYVWYNYARWGVAYDVSYLYYYRVMVHAQGVPFGPQYIPYNLREMFVQPPNFYARWPFITPQRVGPGILFTAWPAGVAFFARRPVPLVLFLWAATVVALIPNLLYWNNGDDQFLSRHALDYAPFVLVLMMLAVRGGAPRRLFVAMLLMSVFSLWLLAHYTQFG